MIKQKEFELHLEDFLEDCFYFLEKIQDGTSGHVVSFNGNSKDDVAERICNELKDFVAKKLVESI